MSELDGISAEILQQLTCNHLSVTTYLLGQCYLQVTSVWHTLVPYYDHASEKSGDDARSNLKKYAMPL
jgi:hypothetical protein